MHCDIEAARGNRVPPDTLKQHAQSPRQVNAPALHADQHDVCADLVALDNLVRDPGECSLHRGGVQYDNRFGHKKTNWCQIAPVRFQE
jgi:hypothetical protein